jgi:2-oxoisovalerate dehydrogenase E2 component (dihydrolipoyl transacylase)
VAEFIELPHVGESVVEGTIGKWLKQPGDRIERYDPLVEVVTDKVTMEVPSPVAGQLLRIIAAEGETVPMGAPIAEVETDERGTPAAQPPNDATTAPAPAVSVPVGTPPITPAATPASPTPTAYLITDARPVGPTGGSAVEALAQEAAATVSDAARPGPLSTAIAPPQAQVPQPLIVAPQTDVDVERAANLLSPAVRRLASEHNIDVSRIAGTGLGGRITRNDVLRFLESAAATDDAPRTDDAAQTMVADGDEERIATTPVRRMIAEAMVRSVSQIPHAWSMVEVDITDLVALRNRERDGFRQREGINLTYLPFALKAVAAALKDNPTLNASWGGDHILVKRRINLGIAVAAPTGLVVPVIRDADRLSIAGLAHSIDDLAGRARSGALRLEDVQGGTFTVNNTGALGSTVSGPIINHPQAGILTTEAVQQRPVVINNAIGIRWMMNICLSFDHRINDGEESGAFLQSVKRRLEAMDDDTPIY